MKNVSSKILMLIASTVMLTACPGKKGNNAAAVPPGAGVCTIGANGLCVGQLAYNGSGRWYGSLNINPAQLGLYIQFMRENNLCQGHECNRHTQFVGVNMRVRAGQGRVTITPYEFNGWSRNRLSRNANVTSVNNTNTFNLVLIDPNYNLGQNQIYGYPQPLVAPTNSIQLNNVFATPYGEVINTTLFYRGIPLATGQLRGQRSPY